MNALHARALELLRESVGRPDADFREGQWDAIAALVRDRARLLLVRRTGWGKSAVYFLGAKLLREQGIGPSLLVSPLLALMRNQIEAAARAGVRAVTINSTNRDEWAGVGRELAADAVDVLLISPERLSNEEFLTGTLLPHAARMGMLIVDEAHCISDWGHDFRPDYRRIVAVQRRLPPNIPVCATTATANDRVVADVTAQLGSDLVPSRGPLVRESLRLHAVPLPDDAAKLAWLAHWVPRFGGSGIIYVLTVRWAEQVAAWLRSCGVNALPYTGQMKEEREERERQLLANEVTALVATSALGMGFDKPDLKFVVHFHQPGSVIHYYQQVGRAGRAIDKAYGVMLSGGDDARINDYFIGHAFPREAHVGEVLEALEASERGLTTKQLEQYVNLPRSRIEQVLDTLAVEDPAPLTMLEGRWVTTVNRYDPARRARLVERITGLRRDEQAEMDRYRTLQGCRMEFLARALDDPGAEPCGKCANCQGRSGEMREAVGAAAALAFLRASWVPIRPRKQWVEGAMPVYGWSGNIAPHLRAHPGRALCVLDEQGWGERVARGKYHDGRFGDDLVEALADSIRAHRPDPTPGWVTCIPSRNHPELVPEFAARVAALLGLAFVPAVRRIRETRPQKEMENSWHQAHNLDGCFEVDHTSGFPDPVILIDDVVDSGWTLTIVAALLRQAGCRAVHPFALAVNRA